LLLLLLQEVLLEFPKEKIDSCPCFPRDDKKRGNWIPAYAGMTYKALFIRVLGSLQE
jgi:hypothetical protein